MSPLILKGMTAGFSTIAVLFLIALLPYALLCYALYHAARQAIIQFVPGFAARKSEEQVANTSTLLRPNYAMLE